MLILDLAGFSDERSWGVSELYAGYCSKKAVQMQCDRCERQGGSFQEQRRLAVLPNVLVVQVRRALSAGAGAAVCRTRVEAEREFSVMGSCESMELWGVVYHEGPSVDSGHYRAAARGPDGMFWLFDDSAEPQHLSTDVAGYRMRQVVLLVYVRMGGGAVLAARGGGGGDSGVGSGGAEVGGSGVGAAGSELRGVGQKGGVTPERSSGSGLGKRASRCSPAVGSARATPPAKKGKCEACGGDGLERAGADGAVPSPPRKCARCGGSGLPGGGEDGGEAGGAAPVLPAFPVALQAVRDGCVDRGEQGEGGSGGGDGKAEAGVAGEASGATGAAVETARWKRFTPTPVDASKCLARTWGDGCGAQCARKPEPGMDLCKAHAEKVGKSGWHGKVTGEIPEDKLKQFERHAAKSSGTGEVGAGGGRGLTRLRRG